MLTFRLLGSARPITFALEALESFRAVEIREDHGRITEGARVRMRSGDEFLVAASHDDLIAAIAAAREVENHR
jgi:hypothetical protein